MTYALTDDEERRWEARRGDYGPDHQHIPVGHIVKGTCGTLGYIVERPKHGPEADPKIKDHPEWVYVRWPSGVIERMWVETLEVMEYSA